MIQVDESLLTYGTLYAILTESDTKKSRKKEEWMKLKYDEDWLKERNRVLNDDNKKLWDIQGEWIDVQCYVDYYLDELMIEEDK